MLLVSWQRLHYISSRYHLPDLKRGISVHSCQQRHIFNQTRKHQQFNWKTIRENHKLIERINIAQISQGRKGLRRSSERFYGGVTLGYRREGKARVRPNSIAIELPLKVEILNRERSGVLLTGCQDFEHLPGKVSSVLVYDHSLLSKSSLFAFRCRAVLSRPPWRGTKLKNQVILAKDQNNSLANTGLAKEVEATLWPLSEAF